MHVLSLSQAYQSILMSYRQSVDSEEGVKQPEWVVRADEDPVHLLTMPTFQEDQYENGIRVVKGQGGYIYIVVYTGGTCSCAS